METTTVDPKSFYYPPGGILLWIIIFCELITFCLGLVFMMLSGQEEPEVFHESRMLLNSTYGAVNTIILLTSGFFMAKTVQSLRKKNNDRAALFLRLTMLGGVLFLAIKGLEYWDKIEAGLIISYNTFFTFYWMLTLFHVVHVIIGLIILWTVYRSISRNSQSLKLEDVEASATFWHMCDLLWLLLFPVVYLIF